MGRGLSSTLSSKISIKLKSWSAQTIKPREPSFVFGYWKESNEIVWEAINLLFALIHRNHGVSMIVVFMYVSIQYYCWFIESGMNSAPPMICMDDTGLSHMKSFWSDEVVQEKFRSAPLSRISSKEHSHLIVVH